MISMNQKAVGRRIKTARERKKLTQEQLAEMVNLSPMHVSVIERGVKLPKLETLINIANIQDVCDINQCFQLWKFPQMNCFRM